MKHLQQGTQEWLDWRKERIGASDTPCIMGVGFKTPFQLWQVKTGRVPPDPQNYAMQRGNELEFGARS